MKMSYYFFCFLVNVKVILRDNLVLDVIIIQENKVTLNFFFRKENK